ncbi:MAG TPA: hypothetical protein VE093_29630 [Polyangiaceae bacterium]|nr:hypothetical protein [Polyangiaceae bacterium]
MSAIRSSSPSPSLTEEPTPKPASAVGTKGSVENEPGSSPRDAERKAALLQYFANPSPEMSEMDAAWQEALALYGDEDSDAWVSALEDGTHPLCKVRVDRRRCA